MTRARHRARGFTLVEVLVAISLFSVLALGAYETLRTVMRSWEITGAHGERLARQRTAERFLRARLEQAVSAAERRRTATRVAFTGGRSEIALVSDFPAHLGAGWHEVQLAFDEGQGGRQLVVRFRPAHSGEAGIEGVGEFERSVLLDDVDEGSIEYYGTAQGEGPPRWQSEWSYAERLPLLVRIRWSLAGGQGWPEIVVAPRNDGLQALRLRSGAGAAAAEEPAAEPERSE